MTFAVRSVRNESCRAGSDNADGKFDSRGMPLSVDRTGAVVLGAGLAVV